MSNQPGNRKHHGGTDDLLIALLLHGNQRFVGFAGFEEGWRRGKRSYAVQLAKGAKDFVVGETIVFTVWLMFDELRHAFN